MSRASVLALGASLVLLGATAVAIGQQQSRRGLARHPAIAYATRPTSDPVADLNRRILDGTVHLSFEATTGYLQSLLDALRVPVESQLLVYSETSLQFDHISRATPRALYFNDAVSAGWVKNADTLEIAAQDPQQGVIFYVLNQVRVAKPQLARSQRCLECHETPATLDVPGTITMSMLPLSDDPNEYATGWAVDHRTPIADRWGGWFVTGATVPRQHLGNVPVYHVKIGGVRAAVAPVLTSVKDAFDTTGYLAPSSDVAALMVFNHQTHMTNLITRLNWEQRVGDSDTTLAKASATRSDEDPAVSFAVDLVDYMLFVDEAPLTSRIQGNSGFAARFMAVGPRDHQGRSLRDLDLETRLFKYPCSYMIYSAAFEGLPARAKSAVYDRLWYVLSGAAPDKAYTRLSPADRQAIIEILRETKHDLPPSFR